MTDHVLIDRRGHAGIITLNRPKALNALTYDMIKAISLQLLEWRDDPEIAVVVIRAAPGRAFCAGGDIAEVTRRINEEGIDATHLFFRHEYRLNWRIHHFPKPFIALIDGITMGGGVGLSIHGRYRVIGKGCMLAMPETAIGLFPDVGGGYLLSRLRGGLGPFMALTGARLHGSQVTEAGLGTHSMDKADTPGLIDALAEVMPDADSDRAVRACLKEFSSSDADDAIDDPSEIDRLFAPGSWATIKARLADDDSAFAEQQRAILARMSPLSLAVSAEQISRARDQSFDDVIRMEYQMVRHFLIDSDFLEGVRAMVVDKDKNPQWRPAPDDTATIGSYFSQSAPALTFDWNGL